MEVHVLVMDKTKEPNNDDTDEIMLEKKIAERSQIRDETIRLESNIPDEEKEILHSEKDSKNTINNTTNANKTDENQETHKPDIIKYDEKIEEFTKDQKITSSEEPGKKSWFPIGRNTNKTNETKKFYKKNITKNDIQILEPAKLMELNEIEESKKGRTNKENDETDKNGRGNANKLVEMQELCERNVENAATGNVKVLSIKEKIKAAFRATIRFLIIVSDGILCLCTLPVIYVGIMLVSKQIEISRVVYQDELNSLGLYCLISGVCTLVIFGPFGIWGTLRKVRPMVTLHNIWLFLNILIQLYILYRCLEFTSMKEAKQKEKFSEKFNVIYYTCWLNTTRSVYDYDRCCCERPAVFVEVCWEYDPGDKKPDERGYREKCLSRIDYFSRVRAAYKVILLFLLIVVAVEAIPLLLVRMTLSIVQQHDDDEVDHDEGSTENLVKVPEKPPKNKKPISLYKKVLFFFVVKRLFLIGCTGLFGLSYIFIKSMTSDVVVNLPLPNQSSQPVNLWNLLVALTPFGRK